MTAPVPDRRRARVPSRGVGMRLDRFLHDAYPQFSRRKIAEAIRAGDVRVNDRPARPGTVLKASDVLEMVPLGEAVAAVRREVRAREHRRQETAPPTQAVVLHRDEDLLVVNKPAGVPVHGGAELGAIQTLLELLRGDVLAGFGLVHRLDRETSGAIALVRGGDLRARTAERFAAEDGGIGKTYEAIVVGVPAEAVGEIDLPLTSPDRRGRVQVDRERGRPARTRYTVVETFEGASRLRLDLLTGRMHQIRAHLAALGHPLLVDRRYGQSGGWRLVDPRGELDARLRRTPLHAWKLCLPHPRTGAPIEVVAPLPGDMRYALEVLRVQAGRRPDEHPEGPRGGVSAES